SYYLWMLGIHTCGQNFLGKEACRCIRSNQIQVEVWYIKFRYGQDPLGLPIIYQNESSSFGYSCFMFQSRMLFKICIEVNSSMVLFHSLEIFIFERKELFIGTLEKQLGVTCGEISFNFFISRICRIFYQAFDGFGVWCPQFVIGLFVKFVQIERKQVFHYFGQLLQENQQ